MPERSTPQAPSSGLPVAAACAAWAAAGLVCATAYEPASRAAQATPLSIIFLIIKRNPLLRWCAAHSRLAPFLKPAFDERRAHAVRRRRAAAPPASHPPA